MTTLVVRMFNGLESCGWPDDNTVVRMFNGLESCGWSDDNTCSQNV